MELEVKLFESRSQSRVGMAHYRKVSQERADQISQRLLGYQEEKLKKSYDRLLKTIEQEDSMRQMHRRISPGKYEEYIQSEREKFKRSLVKKKIKQKR